MGTRDDRTKRAAPGPADGAEPRAAGHATVPLVAGDDDAAALAVGGRIGRFEVLGVLGAGGMGVVLDARDPDLDRPVAIKLLRPGTADDGAGYELQQREAQAMARIVHPNVVAVYEVGVVDGQTFIAMERVAGTTLRAWLERPRGWREVVRMFVAVGRGLVAAHESGVVHRDVKPENVLVGGDGRPRVSDFGLMTGERGDRGDGAQAGGTPAYMSPEHWRGAELDARSDQFSFCVALWEALWGQRPHPADDEPAMRAAVTAGAITPPPSGRGVPSRVQTALRRGLAVDAAARWPTLAALLGELERAAAPRRLPAYAIAGAAAALAGVGVYVAARPTAASGCARAGAALTQAWNDEARHRLRDALAGVNAVYGAAVADRVVGRLDDYGRRWNAMAIESCQATHVRHQQSTELLDRRTVCLDSRRRALAALVDGLSAHPDAATLEAAVKATSGLPELDACADGAALMAAVAPPGPLLRARAATLEQDEAAARTAYLTGHARAGWAQLAALVPQIQQLGYPALTARALYDSGQMRAELANLDEARADYEGAMAAAAAARDDDLGARIALALLRHVGDSQRKLEQAQAMLPLVRPLVTRAGSSTALQAMLLRTEGDLANAASRYEEARAAAEAGLALLDAAPTPDPLAQIAALQALGNIYRSLGQYGDARRVLERALAVASALYGPDHPSVARILNNLGLVAQNEGDVDAMLAYHQRALAIKQRALGEAATTARSMSNISIALSMQGKVGEAVERMKDALAMFERTLGPDHPEVAQNHTTLGGFYQQLGQLDAGRRELEAALQILLRVYGPDHEDVSYPLEALALLESDAGAPAAALAYAERALAARRHALGDAHGLTGWSWSIVGVVKAKANRCRDAMPDFAQARAVIEAAQPESQRLANSLQDHVGCMLVLGLPGVGALAEQTLALQVKLKNNPGAIAVARYRVAAAHDHERTAPRAANRALAEQARAELATLGPDGVASLEEVDGWLASHPATGSPRPGARR